MKKSEKREWKNFKGSGTLFTVTLIDKGGTQMMGNFFNDAAEKYFPHLVEGAAYTFSNGVVRPANKRF
jgi:hypothetical protein